MSWLKPFDWTDVNGQRMVQAMHNSPYIYRTTTQGVAEKPAYWAGDKWAAWMRANFPAWRYNAAQRRWYGPLTDLAAMSDKFPHAIKSDGVKTYLANTKGESNENP